MLEATYARARQERLLQVMQRRRLDAVVVGAPHHVYYLSAYLQKWTHQAAFVLFGDGRSLLVSPNQPVTGSAADDAVAFVAQRFSTLDQEQPALAAAKAVEAVAARQVSRVGVDASAVSSQVALQHAGEVESVELDLHQLRRAKDPDELALMGRANDCTEAMYRRARQIIEPGVPELEVFNQLHAAAVETAGEPLTALLGNDFACGVPGGPPRQGRRAEAGELYILDLGPAYRGYFADNARVISVDRKPTDAQVKLWQGISSVFPLVEGMSRPGVRCRDVFAAVDEHFRSVLGSGLGHHLGHGVGLQAHEYPHMNPRWDDVLIEGEVFTIEPGHYGAAFAGGIRLENNYLVTSDGVRNLTPYPLGLV